MVSYLRIRGPLRGVLLNSIGSFSQRIWYTVSSISEEDATWLDKPFDEDEVFGVVNEFKGDKAPGPDRFTMAFFQSCWSTVKTDVMNVFHVFHAHAVFEKSLNATFLTLIPKKFDAVDVQDFRPISLLGEMYKIIVKVLANRMRMVVHGLNSKS